MGGEYGGMKMVVGLIVNMVWVFIVMKLRDGIEGVVGKGGI